MGNCAGILGACQGDEENPVRKINQENMSLALARNKDLEIQGLSIVQQQREQQNLRSAIADGDNLNLKKIEARNP